MGLLSLREIGLEFGSEIDWWSVIGVIVSPKESNLAELTWYFSSGPNRGPSGLTPFHWCAEEFVLPRCAWMEFLPRTGVQLESESEHGSVHGSASKSSFLHWWLGCSQHLCASLMWLWDIWDDSGSDLGWRLSKLDKKKKRRPKPEKTWKEASKLSLKSISKWWFNVATCYHPWNLLRKLAQHGSKDPTWEMQELPDFEEKAPVITEEQQEKQLWRSREFEGGIWRYACGGRERERDIDGYIYII